MAREGPRLDSVLAPTGPQRAILVALIASSIAGSKQHLVKYGRTPSPLHGRAKKNRFMVKTSLEKKSNQCSRAKEDVNQYIKSPRPYLGF